VIGWPASHPVTPLGGSMVSDWFPRPIAADGQSWPLLEGCVHPAAASQRLAQLRIHPLEVGDGELAALLPAPHALPPGHPLRLQLMQIIAEATSIQAAALEALDRDDGEMAAVHFAAMGHIKRFLVAGGDRHLDGKPAARLLGQVVDSLYLLLDMMLGVLLQRVDRETTVALVSERGFRLDQAQLRDPTRAAVRRQYQLDVHSVQRHELGMLVLRGPGIRGDGLIHGASVLDMAPTLLHQLGIAVARDMDGRVLQQAFSAWREPEWVDSWEPDAPRGELPAALQPEWFPEQPLDEQGVRSELAQVCLDRAYGLAESHLEAHEEGRAAAILERLWQRDPADIRYPLKLFGGYLRLQRPELARATLEGLLRSKKRYAPRARKGLQALEARDPATLSAAERREKGRLWKQSRTNLATLGLMQASLLQAEGRIEEALATALGVDHRRVGEPATLLGLRGDLLLQLGRHEEAEANYRQSLELQANEPLGYLGLSSLRYRQERFKEAADLAARALGLRYFNPQAHLQYARAVFRLGHPRLAADALKVAVAQEPGLLSAYERLVALYEGPLDNAGMALLYRAQLRRLKRQTQSAPAQRRQGLAAAPTTDQAESP